MAAKKSMKFHRMHFLKGRFINSYILFTALRKVVSKEYMKAGKDAMTAFDNHAGAVDDIDGRPFGIRQKAGTENNEEKNEGCDFYCSPWDVAS